MRVRVHKPTQLLFVKFLMGKERKKASNNNASETWQMWNRSRQTNWFRQCFCMYVHFLGGHSTLVLGVCKIVYHCPCMHRYTARKPSHTVTFYMFEPCIQAQLPNWLIVPIVLCPSLFRSAHDCLNVCRAHHVHASIGALRGIYMEFKSHICTFHRPKCRAHETIWKEREREEGSESEKKTQTNVISHHIFTMLTSKALSNQ